MRTFLFSISLFLFQWLYSSPSNTVVQVNLDVRHSVGGIETFDREKFITMHADIREGDWNDASARKKLDYMCNELDVYFGRNNGGITWWATQIEEDPNRPGYALLSDIETRGASERASYSANDRNIYDDRADVMIGGQHHAMWPGYKDGWAWKNADAVGEYMAHYVNHFYRPFNNEDIANGQRCPRFLEILNEPLYAVYDDGNLLPHEKIEPIEVFEFHRDAARAYKRFNSNTQIGGYTTAFPEFDINNFERWENRMKLFIDTAGAEMDFISIHLYDFHRHWVTGNTSHLHFKGSRTDATLDMIENYSMLSFGHVKPHLISEYGGRDHSIERNQWSPERDWIFMKAFTPLLMSFMERPDVILKTIPFIVSNFSWYGNPPYPWRLLRQADEPNSLTGEWVFTEMVKFYELWSDVNGTRIDSWSTNPDVKVDAYVDGHKVYVILSNLSFEKQTMDLDLQGDQSNELISVKIKHLHAVNNLPVLDVGEVEGLTSFVLDPEASAVLEYTFGAAVEINHHSLEHKFYGDRIKQPIQANIPSTFTIESSFPLENGEALLNLSFGRPHELTKTPIVTFNGTKLNVPDSFSGDDVQDARQGFFGMLEIPIPFEILRESNNVEFTFPDSGGHISSTSMRVFDFSRTIERPDKVTAISVYPTTVSIGLEQHRQLTASLIPQIARDIRVRWSSSNENKVTVDQNGLITGITEGKATITAMSLESGMTATCEVQIQKNRVPVEVDSVTIVPNEASVINGEGIQLEFSILPIDADDKSISWSTSDSTIATVDGNGYVSGVSDGTAEIRATASNGSFATSQIISQTKIPGTVVFDDKNKYLTTVYQQDGELVIHCNFNATTGQTVNEDGIKFWLREIRSNWTVERNFVAYDVSAAGEASGTATATISLANVTPSADLTEGNFYYLWLTFTESDNNPITGESAHPINIVAPAD